MTESHALSRLLSVSQRCGMVSVTGVGWAGSKKVQLIQAIMSAESCDWFPLPNQKCVEFTCVAIQFQLIIINTISPSMQFQLQCSFSFKHIIISVLEIVLQHCNGCVEGVITMTLI